MRSRDRTGADRELRIMVRVSVFVRELGGKKPDYRLEFDLPEVPREGSYISIHRPVHELYSEDLIVRKVWWRLHHPETAAVVSGNQRKIGLVKWFVSRICGSFPAPVIFQERDTRQFQ
jgi:hypothetical protein